MPDYGTEEDVSGVGGGGGYAGGPPSYTPPDLVSEWGELQPNGDVFVYQQYSNGQTIHARTESFAVNQAGWGEQQATPQYTPSAPTAPSGGGYPVVRDPTDITPWWNQWMQQGGSGNPADFAQHYQTLFGQTPDPSIVAGLQTNRTGPTGPTIRVPSIQQPKINQGQVPLAANQLEALMAQMAAQFGLQRSQGGFSNWMQLAQAPFQMGTQRSQLLNQLAGVMGWMPYQPQKFGVPEVPNLTPPDWLNKWVSSGYVGG